MTPDNKHTSSFGRYLKSVRVEKGIDLNQIAKTTKIAHSILVNLENEHHGKLPNPLFVKGFIRSYAEIVGADAQMAERSYTDSLEKYKETSIPASERSKRKAVFRYYSFVLSGLLICIIMFSVWLLSDTGPTSEETVLKTPLESEKQQEKTDDITSHNTLAGNTEPSDTDVLTLAVSAVEKAWLKIIIDDQPPEEYHLESGDHLELEASSKFNILVGNAPGIKLLFNNQPVIVSGKRGQAVALKLP